MLSMYNISLKEISQKIGSYNVLRFIEDKFVMSTYTKYTLKTKENALQFIKDYLDGLLLKDIMEKYNISIIQVHELVMDLELDNAVPNSAYNYFIDTSTLPNVSKEQEEILDEMYINGVLERNKKFNTFLTICKKNNINPINAFYYCSKSERVNYYINEVKKAYNYVVDNSIIVDICLAYLDDNIATSDIINRFSNDELYGIIDTLKIGRRKRSRVSFDLYEPNSDFDNKIISLYESGLSIQDVRTKMSCGQRYVYSVLIRNNIKIRCKRKKVINRVDTTKISLKEDSI